MQSEKLKEWGRLGLLIGSVTLGWLAHSDAWSESLPWWWWLLELIGAVTFFGLSQPRTQFAEETSRRRTLRWSAAVVMLTAIFAATTLEQQPGRELAAMTATLVAIVAFAAWRWVPYSAQELQVIGEPSAAPAWGSKRATSLLVGGTLLAAGAADACNFYKYHLAAFLLWFASLVLFALAMWRPRDSLQLPDVAEAQTENSVTFTAVLFSVFAIVGVAMAFRSIHIADIPVSVSIDEGSHGRTTEAFWAKGFPDVFGYTPWNAFPNLSFLVGYIGVQLRGLNYENLRLTSAAIGALSIVPLFFWARRWWGTAVGLMAATLMAFNREHIYWSRLGINNIQSVLVAGLMLATLARALRTRRPIDWVWFGYASGLAFHTYHAAKLYPPLAALILVPFAIGIRGFVRQNRANAVITIVAFLLLLGPLTLSTYLEWSRFYGSTANRTDVQVLIAAFQRSDITGVRNYIYDHVVSCLRCLFNLPPKQAILIGPEAGVLFLLGIAWMFWRWRDPRNWVVLGWIGGILLVGGMMTGDPPWKARMLGFLPALCVVPAIMAERIRVALLRCLPGRSGVVVVATLLMAWLSAIAYRSWDAELVYAAEGSRGDYTGTVCRLINRTPLPATFYAAGCGVSGTLPDHAETMGLFGRSPERKFVDLVDGGLIVPVRPGHHGIAVFVVAANQKEIMPLIAHYYPNALHEPNYTVHGDSEVDFFTISAGEVEQHRGLQITYRSPTRSWTGTGGAEVVSIPPGVDRPVQVTARGQLWVAPPGRYALRSLGGALKVDGRSINDELPIDLVAGWHAVEIEATLKNPSEQVAFEWQPPVAERWERVPHDLLDTHPETHGLLGRYFAKELTSADAAPSAEKPDYAQIEPLLSFYWGTPEAYETPPPVFARRGSTLEWSGTVDLPEGSSHAVRLDTTTPAQVFIDGKLVFEGMPAPGEPPLEKTIAATSGSVPILVRTTRSADDPQNYWRLRLLWSQPGGDWTAFVPYHPPRAATPAG